MIRNESWPGGAFGTAADGDLRGDPTLRAEVSRRLGIPSAWCWLRQVHGNRVLRADAPGVVGEADAVFTTVPGLPLAIVTADCYPVLLFADGAVGAAHAGWRGAADGVVAALRAVMDAAGHPPQRAAIGPGIGACCFEVGTEVVARFPDHHAVTTWGTRSVDLIGALRDQIAGLSVWDATRCTMSEEGFHSFRRDGSDERQISVAWLPA